MTPGRARFDDLVAGTAIGFVARTTRAAWTLDQVIPLLEWVDQATRGGAWAFGHVAYEAAAAFDPALVTHPGSPGRPLAWFALADRPEQLAPLSQAGDVSPPDSWQLEVDAREYGKQVDQVRTRIAAGDTYQVNLTTRARSVLNEPPGELYRRLALGQRGSDNALLECGDQVLVSASPERFFEWSGDTVRCVPMKGTAARGWDGPSDAAALAGLLASEKDRAENLMIVDLVRNDLARVSQPGSVRVEALFAAERYPTVWQLTSTVAATLRPETGLADLFGALFPCGSITGAPKASSMRVITELESSPRGAYCGAIGWVGPPSEPVRARFSVPIRTAEIDLATGAATYGVGAGITWGSDPVAEHDEVLAKTRVLSSPGGDFGLIETLAVVEGVPRHWAAHLARLSDSAAYFGFALDPISLAERVHRVATEAGSARLRVELSRDGSVQVTTSALPEPDRAPVRLAIDDLDPADRVDPTSPWVHHKTTHRQWLTRARQRHQQADEVVLTNRHGQLTEATVANLAVLLDGQWLTPPTSDGCLPGIERGRALAQGRLTERSLTPADLARAEAIALLSSLRGWREATLMN